MSVHEAIAALPALGDADHALIRALLTRRMAYCLGSSEDVTALDVVDPADGVIPLYLIQNGALFAYDSTDTTTAHDGVTCLVTADSKRYKTTDQILTYSVLNSTTAAQPTSPANVLRRGDMYRVPSGATGTDWAGQDGKVAIYTARGWVFQIAVIGQMLYDEATDSYWHKKADGTWVMGFGAQTLGDGAVYPSNMSGDAGKIRFYVENQTTNAPPGSPVANSEYIIGSSPTGAWAGKAAQIARYENGAWVYYVPTAGWKAYDKALANDYTYSGSAWISASGGLTVTIRNYTAGATWSKPSRLAYVEVMVIGGGGGSQVSGVASGAGGTSSFGSHLSATGGTGGNAGTLVPGSPGSGSGGDENFTGSGTQPPVIFNRAGIGAPETYTGGAGGFSRKIIQAVTLGSSETVTVGAAGTAGGSGSAGTKGNVEVREYTYI